MERLDGLPADWEDGTRERDERVKIVEAEGIVGVEYWNGLGVAAKLNHFQY